VIYHPSYLGESAIDIPGSAVNQIADYWYSQGTAIVASGVPKGDLQDHVKRLLATYVQAVVVEGIPPLDMSDPMLWYRDNAELRAYMRQALMLSPDWIDEFLYNLWAGAEAGQIDPKWLSPAVQAEIEPASALDKWKPGFEKFGEAIGDQVKVMFYVTAAGVVVFFLGKELIRAFIRR